MIFSVIFYIFAILLMVIGLQEICRNIALYFLCAKGDEHLMFVVPIHAHDEDAEYLLRSAAAKVRWSGGLKQREVICLDCGMDEKTRKVCELMAKTYKFIEIVDLSEFERRQKAN